MNRVGSVGKLRAPEQQREAESVIKPPDKGRVLRVAQKGEGR